MIFNPVMSNGTSAPTDEIAVFSVTASGTAAGSIEVFDQVEQAWKTPTGTAMDIATGRNLLIQTKVRLADSPSVYQSSIDLSANSISKPINANSYGWYLPDTSGFYGKSISIYANED